MSEEYMSRVATRKTCDSRCSIFRSGSGMLDRRDCGGRGAIFDTLRLGLRVGRISVGVRRYGGSDWWNEGALRAR